MNLALRVQAKRVSRRVSQLPVWKHVAPDMLRKKPSGVVPALNLFNDLSDIYPLGCPMLFHKSLDVLLLLSCTYLVCAAFCVCSLLCRASLSTGTLIVLLYPTPCVSTVLQSFSS